MSTTRTYSLHGRLILETSDGALYSRLRNRMLRQQWDPARTMPLLGRRWHVTHCSNWGSREGISFRVEMQELLEVRT